MIRINNQKFPILLLSTLDLKVFYAANSSVKIKIIVLRWLLVKIIQLLNRQQWQSCPHILNFRQEMYLIAHPSFILHAMKAIVLFKVSKCPLYNSSISTLFLISLLFKLRQNAVLIRFVHYVKVDTLIAQYLLSHPIGIGLVRKYRSFILTNQFVKFQRIKHNSCDKTVSADNTQTRILSNMHFITIISIFYLYHSNCIIVLFSRTLLFIFSNSFFIFFVRFGTSRDFGYTGIDQSDNVKDKLVFVQHIYDLFKKFLKYFRFCQPLSNMLDSCQIRKLLYKACSRESLKWTVVYQRIRQLNDAQIIKVMEKQTLQRIYNWRHRPIRPGGFLKELDFYWQLLTIYNFVNLFLKLFTKTFLDGIINTINNKFSQLNHRFHTIILSIAV